MDNLTKRYGHPEFYKLLEKMAELHSRKNHDYAGTKDPLKNLRSSLRFGVSPFIGVLIRLQDKWSRLEEFINSGTFLVKDESVEDTLMDNAVYSLLAIILRQEEKENKNATIDLATSPYCKECTKRINEAKKLGGTILCAKCSEMVAENFIIGNNKNKNSFKGQGGFAP